MNRVLISMLATALVAVFFFGCSQDQNSGPPGAVTGEMPTQNPASARLLAPTDKFVNTEQLGDPGIAIPEGSGVVIAGVGLTTQPAVIDIDVPGTVELALLYWSGGDPDSPFDGDDTVTVDGGAVTGELIGGPTPFYNTYEFLAYRADITGMVGPGANSFVIDGMDFDPTTMENNGAGILVVYQDGPVSEIQIRDGLDMAFFNFTPPLDATVPQTFTFVPEDTPRSATLSFFTGSVEENRPNEIAVTTSDGVQSFYDLLSSQNGEWWDAMTLDVIVPAGDTELTVELISTASTDPLGASMSWVVCALTIPVGFEEGLCRVTGGCRDLFETGDGMDDYTCGGQAGAPTASRPQPWGEWTHTQKDGPSGSFTFHAGTASAPAGTEIDWITCMDAGWCRQARPAFFKQIDFAGVGTFKNLGRDVPTHIADYVTVRESLHWFEVNIDDLGEPGRSGTVDPPATQCEPMGYGRNGYDGPADCECPDFYRIKIYEGSTDASAVMYEVYGYIDRGNFQIHP